MYMCATICISDFELFQQCGILELFQQCSILELFQQCSILELFQQCGIFLFFIMLLLIVSVNIEQCLSETQ